MKRLGYKKSRTGCRRCKERRVKCDERSPCSACTKHRVACSLAPDPSRKENQPGILQSTSTTEGAFINLAPKDFSRDSSASSPATSTPLAGGAASVPWNPNLSGAGPVPYFSQFLDDLQRGNREDWYADMELMHHYTAVAHSTFTHSKEVHHAFQHDVVRAGLENGFLLQQILAFSGFHLSYTRPDKRRSYILRASYHQDQAIAGLRTVLMGEVTSENCHSLYASSVFLIICAFATFPSYETHNRTFCPVDGITDILRLADGISVILRGSGPEIRGGPLQALFSGRQGSPSIISDRVQELIFQLENLDLLSLAEGADYDDEEIAMYGHLLQAMIDALSSVHRNSSLVVSPELRALFLWPMLLSHRHLDLIRNRRPIALVIMTYYCVVLHYAAEDCWFLEGWALAVCDSLETTLRGTQFEQAINWSLCIVRT